LCSPRDQRAFPLDPLRGHSLPGVSARGASHSCPGESDGANIPAASPGARRAGAPGRRLRSRPPHQG
jgi:hypothetical protein